ncbi:hypothetical protein D3C86_2147910 [compost metagenome]
MSVVGPDLGEGPTQKLPVGHQLLAGDIDMAHIPSASRIDQKRFNVRGFGITGAGNINGDNIGGFSDFERADFVF